MSCNRSQQPLANPADSPAVKKDEVTVNSQSVKNSKTPSAPVTVLKMLSGVYEGVLPCADCQGIQTRLVMEPQGFYSVSETRMGKSDEQPVQSKGIYHKEIGFEGDPHATLYVLTNIKTDEQRYFIQHQSATELIMLDAKKKLLSTSANAALVLKK